MLEKRCYKCKSLLIPDNLSTEHVILNACGGKLKSNFLLCKECNSDFGEKFDNELAKNITPLANLLGIKRERGNPPIINGIESDSKTEYALDHNGNIDLKKPIIKKIDFENNDISKRKIQIQAPNKKILIQTLKGLKRKYPNLDTTNASNNFVYNEEPFDKELKIEMSLGGTETFKSILKTAINFYILKGGNRDEIKHLFKYFDKKQDIDIVWFHYPSIEIYKPLENEIIHLLKVVGNKKEKILYAYIELFSSHCFIIKLNDNYQGENIDIDYIFNVITHETKFGLSNLNLSRELLNNLLENKDVNIHSKVQDKVSRVLKISQINNIKREISKSVDKIFNKHIGQKMNDDISKELENEFIKIIKSQINYKK